MKCIWLVLALSTPFHVFADEYNVDRVVASAQASHGADDLALDINNIKDHVFTIQVSSHLNEASAVEHVRELIAHKETAFYYTNFVKNQVYFKVCTGRFETRELAQKALAEFKARSSETFADVVSLLDHPGIDKKATAAQVTSADHVRRKAQMRAIASVTEKKINLEGEVVAANQPTSIAPGAALKDPSAKVEVSTEPAEPPEVAESPKSEESPEPKGKKTYSIQIASYPYEEMAKVGTAKVDVQGKDVFYKPAVIDGKTWYRLYVGKFTKFNDAISFQKELKQTYDSPIVRKLYE